MLYATPFQIPRDVSAMLDAMNGDGLTLFDEIKERTENDTEETTKEKHNSCKRDC